MRERVTGPLELFGGGRRPDLADEQPADRLDEAVHGGEGECQPAPGEYPAQRVVYDLVGVPL